MLFYAVLYLHFLLENDKLLKNELVFGCFIFDEIKKNEFSEGVFEFSKGDIWKKIPKIWHGIGPKHPWEFISQCEQSSEENEGLWCLTLISVKINNLHFVKQSFVNVVFLIKLVLSQI